MDGALLGYKLSMEHEVFGVVLIPFNNRLGGLIDKKTPVETRVTSFFISVKLSIIGNFNVSRYSPLVDVAERNCRNYSATNMPVPRARIGVRDPGRDKINRVLIGNPRVVLNCCGGRRRASHMVGSN